MSVLIKVFDDLLDSREIINSQVAHVTAYWREVEESHSNPSSGKFVDQSQADFGGHHCNAADIVLHHSLGSLPGLPGIIIGIAEYGVITKLLGSSFKTLDHFREERILDVRDNDPQCAAIARSEVTCVNVREVPETLDGREHQHVRAPTHFTCLVQDVGDRGSGNPCSLRDITNG